ncbi:MAG: hypothetical protein NWQ09_08330, partial [Nonlabens sp.]|nr:hypothetical protein [Nonlabens sp.]
MGLFCMQVYDYTIMKNYILTILAIVFALPVLGQVYVRNGSFIYSKGTNIFVKEGIDLGAGTNIYLRKEAQLIQDDNIQNTGTGELSVFQEGAANNFTYNYWSAPVSQTTGSGNQGFRNSQIKYPTLQAGFKANSFTNASDFAALSTELTTSFANTTTLATSIRDGLTDVQTVSGSTITQTQPLRIAGRWLYKYNNLVATGAGNGYGNWQAINAGQVVEPGYGFSMKGVTPSAGPNIVPQSIGGSTATGQRYDFRGRPNNGTITLSVIADDFALVGNPYPSALDLKRFLEDNSNYAQVPRLDGMGIPVMDGMGNPVYDYVPGLTATIDAQILFWESKATSHQLTD